MKWRILEELEVLKCKIKWKMSGGICIPRRELDMLKKGSIGNTPCPSLCCTQNEVGFEKSQRKNKNQSACNKFSEP